MSSRTIGFPLIIFLNLLSTILTFFPSLKVKDILSAYLSSWDLTQLNRFLAPIDVDRILHTNIQGCNGTDHPIWMPDKFGRFSVKFAYWFSKSEDLQSVSSHSSNRPETSLWQQVWKTKCNPRFAIWLWRCLRDKLPTGSNLRRKNIHLQPLCGFCINREETLSHLLFQCPFFRHSWECLFPHSTFLGFSGSLHGHPLGFSCLLHIFFSHGYFVGIFGNFEIKFFSRINPNVLIYSFLHFWKDSFGKL